jgi:hypothetical protein
MNKTQRELSSVERCQKNKWKKGTILQCKENCLGLHLLHDEHYYNYWKITALGETEVLGRRVHLKPFETTGETIIPFNKSAFTWRKVSSNFK